MAISLHTFPCVKPIDKEAILSAASVAKAVVTIEEHSVIGGFGSAVAEVVAGEGVATPVVRMGIGDEYSKVVGDQGYLRSLYGIDADSIAMKCESIVAS